MKTTPRYRLTSALARLRALGLTEAWRLLPAWELLGELAAMVGVSATALYEPGAAIPFGKAE